MTLNGIVSCEAGGLRYFSHHINSNGSIGFISGVLIHDFSEGHVISSRPFQHPMILSAFFHTDDWDMTRLHLLMSDGRYYRSRYLEIDLRKLELKEPDDIGISKIIEEGMKAIKDEHGRLDFVSTTPSGLSEKNHDQGDCHPLPSLSLEYLPRSNNDLQLMMEDVAELHRAYDDSAGSIKTRDGRLMSIKGNRMIEIEHPLPRGWNKRDSARTYPVLSQWISGDDFVDSIENGSERTYFLNRSSIETDDPDSIRILRDHGSEAYAYKRDGEYYWIVHSRSMKKRLMDLLGDLSDPTSDVIATNTSKSRKFAANVKVHCQGPTTIVYSPSWLTIFNPFGAYPLKIDLIGIQNVMSACMMEGAVSSQAHPNLLSEIDTRETVLGSCYFVLDGDKNIPEISFHRAHSNIRIRIIIINVRHFAPTYGTFLANYREPPRNNSFGLSRLRHDEDYRGWRQNHFDYQEGTRIMRKSFDDQPPFEIDQCAANETVYFGILTTIIRSSQAGNQIFVLNKEGKRVSIDDFVDDDLPVKTIRPDN